TPRLTGRILFWLLRRSGIRNVKLLPLILLLAVCASAQNAVSIRTASPTNTTAGLSLSINGVACTTSVVSGSTINSTINFSCPVQGTQGPPGVIGPQGLPGPQGLTGSQGLPGADGSPGATGPQGDTGPQGPAGANGADGQPGPPGPMGATGLQGPPGVDGATGPQGPQGIQGLPGIPFLSPPTTCVGIPASGIDENGNAVCQSWADPNFYGWIVP